jgi:hypothetical protein
MRKAIVSLGAGPQAHLLRLARRTIEPYARRHGYAVHLHTEALDASRPAPWSKIVALRRLQERYDLLLWLDSDLMVVDGRVDVATELEEGRFIYLVEHSTKEGRMPNSGVMLLRTGDECERFLEEVWAQEDLIDHTWWENSAICRLLGYELEPPRPAGATRWSAGVKLLSGRWNSIHDAPAAHPRIRHYPGYSLKTRAAFMTRDLVTASLRRAAGRG